MLNEPRSNTAAQMVNNSHCDNDDDHHGAHFPEEIPVQFVEYEKTDAAGPDKAKDGGASDVGFKP
jgi:hypothetical protein